MTLLLAAVAVTAAGLLPALAFRHRRGAELVARACHELRNALTALGLVVHTLGVREEIPATRLPALELELERACAAVGDLTAARRGRAGPSTPRPVDLNELLAAAAPSWRALAGASGRELRVRPVPGGAAVHADPARLAQAAGNLVVNAIEHGGGAIELSGLAGRGAVRIVVSDGGPGLPAPVHALVRKRRRRPAGRGRGLAIAAEIAERHGGRLGTAPSSDGARIALELPALPPTEA